MRRLLAGLVTLAAVIGMAAPVSAQTVGVVLMRGNTDSPDGTWGDRQFESVSLQERVRCELGPRGPASGRAMLTSPILVHWNQHHEGGPFEPK
jgi:hypothetical protein